MAITRDFNEFETICEPLDPGVALGALNGIFQERFELNFREENVSKILESQRDGLRVFLHEKNIIDSLNKPESAVVCPEYFYKNFFSQYWV